MTKPVVNIADVPLRDGGNGNQFVARLGRIGASIGAQKLGCQLHIVPAGKKAFPRHCHHANEEMFYVVSGEGTYRVGDETYPIRAGDVIGAPAGDASTAHQIVNASGGELRYLAIGYPHHSSEASGLVSSTFPTMVAYVAGPTATAC
ncbi:MAG: cupin domain-containing protein [Roseiarcus sp.]